MRMVTKEEKLRALDYALGRLSTHAKCTYEGRTAVRNTEIAISEVTKLRDQLKSSERRSIMGTGLGYLRSALRPSNP